MGARLYGPCGDGALPAVKEPPAPYQAGTMSRQRVRVVVEEEHPDGTSHSLVLLGSPTKGGGRQEAGKNGMTFDSRDWSDRTRFQESVLGYLTYTLRHRTPAMAFHQVREASSRYGHGADRGDGRDACGRFVAGSEAARECGRTGFEKVVFEILPQRYPDAVNSIGVHMAFNFFSWLQNQGRA